MSTEKPRSCTATERCGREDCALCLWNACCAIEAEAWEHREGEWYAKSTPAEIRADKDLYLQRILALIDRALAKRAEWMREHAARTSDQHIAPGYENDLRIGSPALISKNIRALPLAPEGDET